MHGSGFLAVYLTGLALGSARIPARQTVTTFHQGLSWVAQVADVPVPRPARLPLAARRCGSQGHAARAGPDVSSRVPSSVFLATLCSPFSNNERLVLGWAGLRGAVPVVLATFPVIAGRLGEPRLLQHRLLRRALFDRAAGARRSSRSRSGWARPPTNPALPITPVDVGTIRELGSEVLEFRIREGDAAVGAHVRDLGLPRAALVTAIIREERAVAPRGATRVHEGDRLQVMAPHALTRGVVELAETWRAGPVGTAPQAAALGPHLSPGLLGPPLAQG